MFKPIVIFVALNFLLTSYVSDVKSEKQPAVRTPLGEVAGYYMQTRGGRQIAAFTAIPFAAPPVGDLRFKVNLLFHILMIFAKCKGISDNSDNLLFTL